MHSMHLEIDKQQPMGELSSKEKLMQKSRLTSEMKLKLKDEDTSATYQQHKIHYSKQAEKDLLILSLLGMSYLEPCLRLFKQIIGFVSSPASKFQNLQEQFCFPFSI